MHNFAYWWDNDTIFFVHLQLSFFADISDKDQK